MAPIFAFAKWSSCAILALWLFGAASFNLYPGVTLGDVMQDRINAVLEALTLGQYFMGRDEEYKDELTDDIRGNAYILVDKVNGFLREHGLTTVKVSSGWRPAAINRVTKNAAPRSLHLIGRAVDISDHSGVYAHLFAQRPDLLAKYGLWMENPKHTPGWVHLDDGVRAPRPIRIFEP